MSYSYELDDSATYILCEDGVPALRIGPEVAVAYSARMTRSGETDYDSVVRHKHGSPEDVLAWFDATRKKYVASGLQESANELCVIQGAFALKDLNAMLDTTGYLGVFLKRMHVLHAQQQVSADAAPDEQQGQLAPMRERAQG